jgi:hypothetical protein
MASIDYKAILLGQSRSELNITAKKLRIKNYSHGTKEELAELILGTRTTKQIKRVIAPSFWNRYHNHIYGIASIIGVILAVWALPRSNQEAQRSYEPANLTSTNSRESSPRPLESPPHSSPAPASPSKEVGKATSFRNKQPAQETDSASVHVNKARELISRGPKYYSAAFNECNRALRFEPNNREALELKHSITDLRRLEKKNQ